MARKSKTAASAAAEPATPKASGTAPQAPAAAPAKPRGVVRGLFQPKLLFILAVSVLAANCLPLLRSYLPDLSKRPEYRLTAAQIRVTQTPHWVPHNIVEQVVQQGNLPEEMSLLDEHLTQEIADAFQLNPWVERVESVRKSVPGQLEVKLVYRRPVAMVQVKQGMYPVDGSGILLPPENFSVADTRLYPLITNVLSTPQGAAGTSWGDVVVVGAARLADELAPHWKKFGLNSIDCPRTARAEPALDDGVYLLTSTGGSQIIWGRAPGSDHPGELSTDQKIGRLKKYITLFGGFERPHGPYEIDIRHWQEIVRRPLLTQTPPATQARR